MSGFDHDAPAAAASIAAAASGSGVTLPIVGLTLPELALVALTATAIVAYPILTRRKS